MKKIILIFSFLMVYIYGFSQNYRGYNIEAFTKLEAKRAFVVDLDTFYATTQLSGTDTTLVSLKYLDGFQNYHGVYDRAESTIAYNDATRTLTVTPTGTDWKYYFEGVSYDTTTITVTHPDVTGDYFLYVDENRDFVFSTTVWDLLTDVPIAYVYYNSTKAEGIVLDERHAHNRNRQAHLEFHRVIGTYKVSGMGASGYTIQPVSPTDADNTFALSAGVIADEDIQHTMSALADGGPYTILYRTGASGDWTWIQNSVPYPFAAGGYIQYNEYTGATWQLTQASVNNWMNIWVCKTGAVEAQYQTLIIVDQEPHDNAEDADNQRLTSQDIGNLPLEEITSIYKFTFRTNAAYGSSGKVRIYSVSEELGNLLSVDQAQSTNDHTALSNLTWDLSGHHGTANTLAAFDVAGLPVYETNNADDWNNAWDSIPELRIDINQNTSDIDVLQSTSHDSVTLTTDDIQILSATGQDLTFNSSNVAKLNAANTFTQSQTMPTAKLINLTDGFIPYHISDASGLGNSGIRVINPSIIDYNGATSADFRILGGTSYSQLSLLGGLDTGSGWGIFSDFPAANDFTIRRIGVFNALNIKSNGNVLINTTTDSGYKLDVNGDINISTGNNYKINGVNIFPLDTTSTWINRTNWLEFISNNSGTGSDSYISNVGLSGNTMSFTGVNDAFNSTVGNIANLSTANTFVSNESGYKMTVRNSNTSTTFGDALFVGGNATALEIANGTSVSRFEFMGDGKAYFKNLTSATKANVLYIDPTTKEITEGAAPGGSGSTDLTFSGTSSPITLNSSSGTDVTFTATGGTTFSATSGNISINSFTNPMSAPGSMIYRKTDDNPGDVPIGSIGQHLGIIADGIYAKPSWQWLGNTSYNSVAFSNGSGVLTNDAAAFTYNTSTNTLDVDNVTVDDEVYGAGWNGSLEAPTKNALYDKIETISGASFIGVKAYNSSNQGITGGAATDAVVVFNSEDYDTGSDFSSNTFTAPENGYYRAYFNTRITTSVTNPTFIHITFNVSSANDRGIFSWSNQDVLQQNYSAQETFYMTASQTLFIRLGADEDCTLTGSVIMIEKL